MNQDDELPQNEPPGAGEPGMASSPDHGVSRGDPGRVPAPVESAAEPPAAIDPVGPVAELQDGGNPLAAGSSQDWDGDVAASGGQLPRPLARGCLVMASLTLIVTMIAVAVTGFTGSTWNYSRHTMDREASAQLANLADAMTAAGAPRAAVLHVRAAAQPGINRGAALEALGAAVQILAEAGDDPHLVPLRRQLHRVYLEIYEKEYGTPPTPDRQRPTVPSFEAKLHFGFWILDFGLARLDFGVWGLDFGLAVVA